MDMRRINKCVGLECKMKNILICLIMYDVMLTQLEGLQWLSFLKAIALWMCVGKMG